jgi:hypothetical protein
VAIVLYKVYQQQPAKLVCSGTESTDRALWNLSVILAEIAESMVIAAETAQSGGSRNTPTGSEGRSPKCLG